MTASLRQLALIPAICLMALSLLVGCRSNISPNQNDFWISGYSCCNLHYDPDENWISDGYVTSTPFIPAGTPVNVANRGIRGFRVDAEISGRHYRFGQDYGRSTEPFENWIKRLVVSEDPKLKIASWPPEVRQAVREGKILIGMTKEQVITSLGPPLRTSTPNLNAKTWRYWQTSFNEYDIHWENDRVSKVTQPTAPLGILKTDQTGTLNTETQKEVLDRK